MSDRELRVFHPLAKTTAAETTFINMSELAGGRVGIPSTGGQAATISFVHRYILHDGSYSDIYTPVDASAAPVALNPGESVAIPDVLFGGGEVGFVSTVEQNLEAGVLD